MACGRGAGNRPSLPGVRESAVHEGTESIAPAESTRFAPPHSIARGRATEAAGEGTLDSLALPDFDRKRFQIPGFSCQILRGMLACGRDVHPHGYSFSATSIL